MNEIVKQSIDGRKNAFFSAYEVNDQNLVNEINTLFDKIYAFGETCSDSMEFESKFATNPLNQEYILIYSQRLQHLVSLLHIKVIILMLKVMMKY